MINIAQLIKLLDYISRYETNPFHYPTQYIRLKQENWKKLSKEWEDEMEERQTQSIFEEEEKKATFLEFKLEPFSKKGIERRRKN